MAELLELLEGIKSIPAEVPGEPDLMTLLDKAEEWLARSDRVSVSGNTTRHSVR
jgi:hypothetical protein